MKVDISPFYNQNSGGGSSGESSFKKPAAPSLGAHSSPRLRYLAPVAVEKNLVGWDFLYNDFPRDLVRSVKNLLTGRDALFFAAGLGAAVDTIPNDRETSDFMIDYASRNMAPLNLWGDPFLAGAAPIGAFIAARLLGDAKLEKLAVVMGETMALGDGIGTLIRMSVHRTKPNRRTNWSFPSGHTFHAFAIATSIQEVYGYEYGIPALMLAAGTAFARVYDRQHYPSDVLAGAILGVTTAWSVYDSREGQKRHYALLPLVVTDHHAFGLQIVFWD